MIPQLDNTHGTCIACRVFTKWYCGDCKIYVCNACWKGHRLRIHPDDPPAFTEKEPTR